MPLTQVNPGLLDTQAQYTGFKNRLINGAMGIWQRGTSSSSGAANAYLADRFLLANWTSASQSSDVPSNQGFQYSIEFTNSSPTYPLIGQRIESSNCRDLAGQTVTVSYWAKNVSGSAVLYSEIYIANSADNFSSLTPVGTVQASAANPSSSWTYYSGSITLPAGAANGIQLNVVRNNASVAVTRVTGVQLEKGSTATSFDYRPYGTELMLCQRYYQVQKGLTAVANSTTSVLGCFSLFTQMRSSPTLGKTSGNFQIGDMVSYASNTSSTPNIEYFNNDISISYSLGGFSGLTSYRSYRCEPVPAYPALFTLSSEL